MSAECWADPLSRAERRELAVRLARAARFFGAGASVTGRQGNKEEAAILNAASADMADLHLDVTERAVVATS